MKDGKGPFDKEIQIIAVLTIIVAVIWLIALVSGAAYIIVEAWRAIL